MGACPAGGYRLYTGSTHGKDRFYTWKRHHRFYTCTRHPSMQVIDMEKTPNLSSVLTLRGKLHTPLSVRCDIARQT